MTIRGLFEKCVRKHPEKVAQKWFENKEWHTRTWGDFQTAVKETAEG
jgi:long-subunit acyl-CoA synthetase (AMP-forming)